MSSDKLKQLVTCVDKSLSPTRRRFSSSSSTDKSLNKYLNDFEADKETWENEKQEFKEKIAELEEFKTKYEDENRKTKTLQNRLNEVMSEQSEATQTLVQTNKILERLRLDHEKKVEQIEKLQRDISYKDDKIRNLEIRASEVEKAELKLETTKQILESTQQQVKDRDSEIRQLEKDVDDYKRHLETAKTTINDLKEKMEDMKIQIRHELMKNENIEKNLESIPRLKDTIQERDVEIRELKKQIDDKNALLTAARRTFRENKERLRYTEQEIAKVDDLKENLQLSQFEVITLKRLMNGKDYLVSKKSKALDITKEILRVLKDSIENEQIEMIQKLIQKLNATYEQSTNDDSSFRTDSIFHPRDSRQFTSDTDYRNSTNRLLSKKCQNQVNDATDKRKRPVSAMALSFRHKTVQWTSYKEAQRVYTNPLPRKSFDMPAAQNINNKMNSAKLDSHVYNTNQHSMDSDRDDDAEITRVNELQNGVHTGQPRSCVQTEESRDCVYTGRKWTGQNVHINSDAESVASVESSLTDDVTPDDKVMLQHLQLGEQDAIISNVIEVGDRVLIEYHQKSPKYGKKRVSKPVHYTGIVKFKGILNPDKYNAGIHIGLRMDEQVGDTDGTYRGKRFMYTPADQGKFCKVREIISILNVKTGRYIPVERLLIHYLHKKKKHHLADNNVCTSEGV